MSAPFVMRRKLSAENVRNGAERKLRSEFPVSDLRGSRTSPPFSLQTGGLTGSCRLAVG